MEEYYITQFKNLFGLSFNDVLNIEYMGIDTDDDGIYHYINVIKKDVYSFDTFDNIWLNKNSYKYDILNRLKIPF